MEVGRVKEKNNQRTHTCTHTLTIRVVGRNNLHKSHVPCGRLYFPEITPSTCLISHALLTMGTEVCVWRGGVLYLYSFPLPLSRPVTTVK